MLAEKQEQYALYKTLWQDVLSYRTVEQNVDKILDLASEEQEQQEEKVGAVTEWDFSSIIPRFLPGEIKNFSI